MVRVLVLLVVTQASCGVPAAGQADPPREVIHQPSGITLVLFVVEGGPSLYVGRTEVTRTQWERAVGAPPPAVVGDKVRASWNATQIFLARTNLRLPTWREWITIYQGTEGRDVLGLDHEPAEWCADGSGTHRVACLGFARPQWVFHPSLPPHVTSFEPLGEIGFRVILDASFGVGHFAETLTLGVPPAPARPRSE